MIVGTGDFMKTSENKGLLIVILYIVISTLGMTSLLINLILKNEGVITKEVSGIADIGLMGITLILLLGLGWISKYQVYKKKTDE